MSWGTLVGTHSYDYLSSPRDNSGMKKFERKNSATPTVENEARPGTARRRSSLAFSQSRRSSINSLKTLSFSLRPKRKPSEAQAVQVENVHVGIQSLPSELQLDICDHLTFSDICNLRATCTTLNLLVSGSDSALARHWARTKLDPIQQQLYPAPPDVGWEYLTTQMHKWNVARNLAELLAKHIQYKILLQIFFETGNRQLTTDSYSSAQIIIRFRPVARRIRRRMTPLLFIIGHYLSSCQNVLIRDGPTATPTYGNGISHILGEWDKTSSRFALYKPGQLFAAHYTWLFLEWLFKQLLSRPSYVGTIERTMRRWNAAPLEPDALVQILLQGNLTAIKQFMRHRDYNERKKWGLGFLKSLDPEQNPSGWEAAWTCLDMRDGRVPRASRASAILSHDFGSLWTEGASEALQEHGIELETNEMHGNAATTMRYLIDLAGFDIFHEEPPPNLLEDDEDEDKTVKFGERADAVEDEEAPTIEEEATTIAAEIEEGRNYWDV